jgi:hypothetical protein
MPFAEIEKNVIELALSLWSINKVEEMGGDQVGGRDPIPPTKRAYSQNIVINVHYIYLFWSSKASRIGA